MRHYRIAFCGLGSIGKRHLRNVVQLLSDRGDSFKIDLYRSSVNSVLPEDIEPFVSNVYAFEDEIKGKRYDTVFVTNPTSMHLGTILKFKGCTESFFIEKPVFDTTAIDEEVFGLLQDKICYVACPLRYSAVLQYVRQHIDYRKAIAVRAISSSYLPDWRPGQDYRKCYSAHRDMGGGVGIDLIHEWDYLTWMFGMPTQCRSIQDTVSDLEIDSDDIAIYIARNDQVTFELHLDYFGRSSIREFEIYLPDETVLCDIQNGRITYLRSGERIQLESDRNEYQIREIEHFFHILNKEITNDSTMEHAFHVLKITEGGQI